MKLGAYLEWAMKQPWGWGSEPGLDCCKFVALWVLARGHPDPMGFLHGTYRDPLSALRRIEEGGGLVEQWTRGMRFCSEIEPLEGEPVAGDVAVIRRATTCGTDEAAAIYTGARWASLGLRGLDFGPAEPIRVWRV